MFVSSTLNEAAPERVAARAAIEALHLTPVMFDLGARPYPPQQLYRSYLEQSDVFIGIYVEQYGWIGPEADISGLEDEFRLSGDRPKLMYLKNPAPERDPRLTAMIDAIWASAGTSTSNYSDPEQLGKLIADDLAVLLSERFDEAGHGPAGQVSDEGLSPVHPPSPVTALLGRDADVDRAAQLLHRDAVRLITLTGPGGVGKTRVGLAVVEQVRAAFDVVAFADLSAVDDAAAVPAAVAGALGITALRARDPLTAIADRLGGRKVLVLLDNVEHVLDAAADIGRLLTAVPGLTVLATSRTALRLRAEHELPVDPLAPAAAVELFEARVQKVRPGFVVDASNAAAVGELVRRLEGLPLAIELAAARARLLPPHALLSRLGNVLDLKAADVDVPDRQFTLRCTIGWSFDLLGAEQRDVLEQLSVFPAGFSLTAAEAVVRPPVGEVDVLDALSDLIQQSLVVPSDSDGGPRFRMYEPVRAFAAEQLVSEVGEARRTPAMHRLSGYLCDLGTTAGAEAGTAAGRAARQELDADLDAVRATFRWAVAAGDAALAVRLGGALARYLWSRGMLAELSGLVESTAAMPAAAGLDAEAAGRLVWARGSIALGVGRFADAVPLLEAAVVAARAADADGHGDWLVPHALFSLAIALPYESQAERMGDLLREALTRFETVGDSWGVAVCLIPLGEISLRAGDLAAAQAAHERALTAALRIEDDHLVAQCRNQLALDAFLLGDLPGARSHLLAAAGTYAWLPDQEGLAYCLDGFGALALGVGDVVGAARLLGTAERVRTVAGVAVWPLMQPLVEQFRAGVAAAAGDAFDAAWAEGAAARPLAALEAAVQVEKAR